MTLALFALELLVLAAPEACDRMVVVVPDDYTYMALLDAEIVRDFGPTLADTIDVRSPKTLTDDERAAIARGSVIGVEFDDRRLEPDRITDKLSDVIERCERPPPDEPKVDEGQSPETNEVETDTTAEAQAPEAAVIPAPVDDSPSSTAVVPAPVLVEAERSVDGREFYVLAPPKRTVGRGFTIGGLAFGASAIVFGAVWSTYDGDCTAASCEDRYQTKDVSAAFMGLGAMAVTSFGIALLVDEIRLRRWNQRHD